MARVLHVLSQRPLLTGSGVTLDALVRHAAADGIDQHAVVGTPVEEPIPGVADLESDRVDVVRFGPGGDLPYPVPGMSDVMPYSSTRFSSLDSSAIERYLDAWRRKLHAVIERFRPDLVHAHHVWLVGSIVKDVAPDIPVVTHCHATGFRQMTLCPAIADRVRHGCARNDAFAVLHEGHRRELIDTLGVGEDRVRVVGAGFRDDLFRDTDRAPHERRHIVYVGKFSRSKGVAPLLDAVERLATDRADLRLHVAGGGAGDEADALRSRMQAMAPVVEVHGQLSQPALADLMRRCDVCVLPSFYEGVPLVLAEARACGCAVVATALPGVVEQLAPALGDALHAIAPPDMIGIDEPDPHALRAFTDRLVNALRAALDSEPGPANLESLTWRAVHRRVDEVWRTLGLI